MATSNPHCTTLTNADPPAHASAFSTPPSPELFGRETLVESLQAALADPDCRRAILRGPTGIGKSAVLLELKRRLNAPSIKRICIYHEIETAGYSVQHFLGRIVAQIIENVAADGATFEDLISRLRDTRHLHTWSLTKALLADAVGFLIPQVKTVVNSILSSLDDLDRGAAPERIAETILQRSREDQLASFVRLVAAIAEKEMSGVILVDRIEGASSDVRSTVRAISYSLPDTWAMVVSANDETSDGLIALNELNAELFSDGAREFIIDSLSREGLEEWVAAVRQTLPPSEVIRTVLEECDGRPLYLKDWVYGLTSDDPREKIARRTGAYYERRLSVLPEASRRLIRALSLFPEKTQFPSGFCAQLTASASTLDSIDTINSLLAAHFLRRPLAEGDDALEFAHEATQRHIRAQIPKELRASVAQEVLQIAMSPSNFPRTPTSKYCVAILAAEARDNSLTVSLSEDTSPLLEKMGAFEAAGELSRIGRIAASSLGDERRSLEFGLREAFVRLHLGNYEEALELLRSFEESRLEPEQSAEAALLLSKTFLRQNRYEESQGYGRKAIDFFTGEDLEKELEARRTLNTIHRDIGEYSEAVATAELIVAKAEAARVGPLSLGRAYRTAARSYALARNDERAFAAATEALSLGEASGSVREIGNAFLCLGEAYRHSGNQTEAIVHYEKAADIARRTGNRDSFLWSALGLSDSLFLDSEAERAMMALKGVGAIVGNAANRYPLEHLHWSLAMASLEVRHSNSTSRSLPQLVAEYQRLGVSWPSGYVDVLLSGRPLPPKAM